MTTTVRDLGEDRLVERLIRAAPGGPGLVQGAGDDCAVARPPAAGELMLLKTDAVVEHVHFTGETPPHLVGRKALARVLSDIAAMGGTPVHALVTLILPPDTPVAWVEKACGGLFRLAARHGVSVAGGETTRGLQRVISVSLTGTVPKKGWLPRGGGKAGDTLLVTGRLGGSQAGGHLRFEPRLEQGRWLAATRGVHAMMDLSDGLAKDLPRLSAAAGLGFEIDWSALPKRRGCSVEQAWGEGEDYELLLAAAPAAVAGLLGAWRQRFPGLPLTAIGRLTPAGEGMRAGELPPGGWDGFTSF
jgi:thiamine-monophosphate kinase